MRSAFWDRQILGWENSRYSSGFNLKGWSLQNRMKLAARILNAQKSKLSVVDLGCGSGKFFELLKREHFAELTGLDFASSAIELAKSKSQLQNVNFICGDVTQVFPEGDCYVGLGLLDWLTMDEIQMLLKKMEGKKFLFSFSEKRMGLIRAIHASYRKLLARKLQSDLVPQYHSTEELLALFSGTQKEQVKIIRPASMLFGSFLTNLELPRNLS